MDRPLDAFQLLIDLAGTEVTTLAILMLAIGSSGKDNPLDCNPKNKVIQSIVS